MFFTDSAEKHEYSLCGYVLTKLYSCHKSRVRGDSSGDTKALLEPWEDPNSFKVLLLVRRFIGLCPG